MYDELTLTDLNALVERGIDHNILGGPTYHPGNAGFYYLVHLPDAYQVRCSRCAGDGSVWDQEGDPDKLASYVPCPSCGGEGFLSGKERVKRNSQAVTIRTAAYFLAKNARGELVPKAVLDAARRLRLLKNADDYEFLGWIDGGTLWKAPDGSKWRVSSLEPFFEKLEDKE